jgi:polysaccharide export outer membrane protein
LIEMRAGRGARWIAAGLALLAVGACELPRTGPNKTEIFDGSVLNAGNAFVVSVDDRVVRATTIDPTLGFASSFREADVMVSDMIAPGDVLSLTVFENVRDDPLLGNTGQRVSTLSEVQVDGQGFIFVPYAGLVMAAGETPESLRQSITGKLDIQTPDPQVAVTRVAGDGATVTVSGAVGAQGVYPIERPTRTLTAMIARAGGISIEPESALVRVTRGGRTGQVWLQDLNTNPALDIALRPDDRIFVERDTRSFVALGATRTQTRIPFETQSLSAIEALAAVGGLNPQLADPTAIFVFRSEGPRIANAVLGRSDLTGEQRFIYVLDLTKPMGIFEAREFDIRDGDTVYVTEAPYAQFTKALAALNGTATSASALQGLAE